MDRRKKLSVIVIIFAVICIAYLSEYRFTGLQAAMSHFSVGDSPDYINEVNYDWGTVFIFKTEEGPRTIISERRGLLWVAQVGFHMKTNYDEVSVIGWGNSTKCTVYCVELNDNEVSYIEMGKGEHRIRQYKNNDNEILFAWDIQIPWNDLNGIAYSNEGDALYEFGYPKDTKTLRMEDLKWYKIK